MNIVSIVLAAVIWLISLVPAYAWPNRPITLVIPFSAGGGTDAVARAMQSQLSKELGQPVIVEYRPGAGGAIALNHVINSKDDHKVLFTTTDVVVTAAATDPNFSISNIQPVSVLVKSPLMLATRTESIHQDFRTVMQRINTDHITFGSPSMGTISHVTLEKMLPRFTSRPLIVHYKGGNPMATDTAGGHNDISISSYGGTFQSWIESGRLRPILVFNETRLKKFPMVPTAKELGIDIVASASFMVFANTSPSKNEISVLNRAFTSAATHQDVRELLSERGNEVLAYSVSDSKKFLDRELISWTPHVREAYRRMDK